MKASEAAKLADTAAAKLERERKAKEAKNKAAAAVQEKNKRAAFREDLRARFTGAIDGSVRMGKRSAFVVVVRSMYDRMKAADLLDNHEYKDIIGEVIKEVEKEGYQVEGIVKTYTWRTSNESSIPNYDCSEFQKVLEVRW